MVVAAATVAAASESTALVNCSVGLLLLVCVCGCGHAAAYMLHLPLAVHHATNQHAMFGAARAGEEARRQTAVPRLPAGRLFAQARTYPAAPRARLPAPRRHQAACASHSWAAFCLAEMPPMRGVCPPCLTAAGVGGRHGPAVARTARGNPQSEAPLSRFSSILELHVCGTTLSGAHFPAFAITVLHVHPFAP